MGKEKLLELKEYLNYLESNEEYVIDTINIFRMFLEAQKMYTNIRRPSNKAIDLDFEIDSSKGYTHVDYKTPIDF